MSKSKNSNLMFNDIAVDDLGRVLLSDAKLLGAVNGAASTATYATSLLGDNANCPCNSGCNTLCACPLNPGCGQNSNPDGCGKYCHL
jgi:hypothetical protein